MADGGAAEWQPPTVTIEAVPSAVRTSCRDHQGRVPERSSEHAPGSARSGGLSSARHAASCADSGPATAKFLRLTLRRDPNPSIFGQWILSQQRFGRSLRGRDLQRAPGQMGYSSTLSDRRDVTRVDCRIEDVVYLADGCRAVRFDVCLVDHLHICRFARTRDDFCKTDGDDDFRS